MGRNMVKPSRNSLKGSSDNASELDRIREMQSRRYMTGGRPGDAFVMPSEDDMPNTPFGIAMAAAIRKKKKG